MIKMNKKKSLLLIWISTFILFTSLVFYVIGCNSNYLVKNIFKLISLIVLIISVLSLIIGIVSLIKNKHRKAFSKAKMIVVSVLIVTYMFGCSTFLFILYGPFTGFKEWLITTAMATMNHQYYCKWFYSTEEINKVLGNNYIDDGGKETDPTLVDHKETLNYKNEYEKQILERNKDDLYKIIKFKVNGCDAYLGVVYDPSKISVGYSKWLGRSGQYIYDMAKEQNSVLTINGGGFMDPNYNSNGANPVGLTISNGKIITDHNMGGAAGIVGFNSDNTLVLLQNVGGEKALEMGIRDAVSMGPFLIVNGEKSFTKGNGGWGYAARTAIGQRKDGIVLMLVVDSNATRTKGASMKDLVDIMDRYGAINAANLDGGTSSVIVEKHGTGKDATFDMLNDPIDSALRHRTRGIPTIFKVVE